MQKYDKKALETTNALVFLLDLSKTILTLSI